MFSELRKTYFRIKDALLGLPKCPICGKIGRGEPRRRWRNPSTGKLDATCGSLFCVTQKDFQEKEKEEECPFKCDICKKNLPDYSYAGALQFDNGSIAKSCWDCADLSRWFKD